VVDLEKLSEVTEVPRQTRRADLRKLIVVRLLPTAR
jgi:hypothetical protein